MEKEKVSLVYKTVKGYFRFVVNGLYNRHFYCIDVENMPPEGVPCLVVSDHQNCLNDALGVLFSVNDRKMHFIARADAFDIHPLFRKFLLWAGVLPAYRIDHEGEEALGNNQDTFRITEQNLIDGRSILLFPEAGHQTGHWLGFFSLNYAKMAFECAEKTGFEKEVFIMPSCNHYTDYHGMRNDMLIRFGTPISVKPWYELFKTKPRTAMREVNKLVKEQIHSLMLDIQDLDNYDEIDYLRQSGFGREFALKNGYNPDYLPEKLEADKKLVALLAEKKATYEEVKQLREALAAHKLQDRHFDRRPRPLLLSLLALLLLPLAIVGVWPALPAWFIPMHFAKRMEDNMWDGTFLTAMFSLVIFPLSVLITLLVEWTFIGAWSLLHVAAIPALCVFEWYWFSFVRNAAAGFRFRKYGKKLRPLRESVFRHMKQILGYE